MDPMYSAVLKKIFVFVKLYLFDIKFNVIFVTEILMMRLLSCILKRTKN